jgi:N-acetylglucosaminyl-diphospho-decaprenol L-rhamnosyltransferase
VAIVLHDSRRDLEARFAGQLGAARELGAPLVCVDNDSRDGGPEMVRELAGDTDDVAVIRMGRNAGYAAGVNAALAASAPRDLMLINPDVGLASAA